MLYLLKGSRVREYHQQNVTILGAAEGDHTTITYGKRWIQQGLSIAAGDPCVIVYADSPYESFVPVRFAVVGRVDRSDERLEVDVRLGTYVRAGAAEPLTERWSRFERDDPSRPGRLFAFEDDNHGLVAPRSLDEQDQAWREIVDGLASNGYFDRSTFARVTGVTDHRGAVIDDGTTRVGEPIRLAVELRTPTAEIETVDFFVDSTPEGGIRVDSSDALPATGTASIELVPSTAGPITVTVGLLPETLLSSRLSLNLMASPSGRQKSKARTLEEDEAATSAAIADETRQLVNRLRRDAQMKDEAWFALYEDLLLRWAPDDPVILTGFARRAYDIGRCAECVDALQSVGQRRRPEDDFLLLLASLRAGLPIELNPLLDHLDLNTERDFEALLGALGNVDVALLEQITVALTASVLGEDKLLRFLDQVFPRLPWNGAALDIAEHAAFADPDRGADLLLRRWPNASTAPEQVVARLIDWGGRPQRLGPYLDRAVAIAEAAHDWLEVERLAKQARSWLTGSDRTRVLSRAGEALLLSGNPPAADAGFGLLAEVVTDSATRGDLDAAVRYAEALVGYAATRGTALVEASTEIRDQVSTAVAGSAILREWRAMRDENLSQELARHLRGKVLHLVGGQREPWATDLQASIGFADVRWHETDKRGSNHTDWANALVGDRDVVVVLWDHIGHAVSGAVKDKCTRKGVPRADSQTSHHDVLVALDGLAQTIEVAR